MVVVVTSESNCECECELESRERVESMSVNGEVQFRWGKRGASVEGGAGSKRVREKSGSVSWRVCVEKCQKCDAGAAESVGQYRGVKGEGDNGDD